MNDELTLDEKETLDAALASALPSYPALERTFLFGTGVPLGDVVQPTAMPTVRLKLIGWLDANPIHVRPFLRKALQHVPGNPRLLAFVKDYCAARNLTEL